METDNVLSKKIHYITLLFSNWMVRVNIDSTSSLEFLLSYLS